MTIIAVLADCHIHPPRISWPADLAARLGPCEAIITLGDMGEGLAALAAIAPVQGVRGEDDLRDDRAQPLARVVEAGGVRLGLVFDPVVQGLAAAKDPFAWRPDAEAAMARLFGGPVDVLLHASTHVAAIDRSGGRHAVNPGSLTLPSGGPAAFARLTIQDGRVVSEIVVL